MYQQRQIIVPDIEEIDNYPVETDDTTNVDNSQQVLILANDSIIQQIRT